MEMGKEEIAGKDYLMEFEPMSRLKTQYLSLRRQLYFIQSICVLFCFTCCLFTITYHSYPSTCKENGTKEAPKYGMQYQESKEMIPTVTRLTANVSAFAGEAKHVPWMHASESYHSGYFTLDEDGVSLTVIHDGMYKVSLQITYRGVEERNDTLILQHDIHHYTDRYDINLPLPAPLLTYLETVNFTSPYWKKSLFSEGIFFLKSGDKLKVWTNSISLIDVGEKKTAFVVYPHFST